MNQGTLCLSFDVEGHWGRIELTPDVAREHEMVTRLLSLLESKHMRATWGVVGKLFEEEKMLVRELRRSGHEIASHSYTHPDFAKISGEEAREELMKSKQVAQTYNVRLQSFIFPYNHVNHADILAHYGFRTYRKGGMYFPSRRKLGRFIPVGWRYAAAKYGIDHAVSSGSLFHLWTHPIDLVREDVFDEFAHIISYASSRVARKQLSISTMDSLPYDKNN